MDPRAKAVLARHGIAATDHAARAFDPAWFAERELILALDTEHYDALLSLAPTPEEAAKVRMLRSFDAEVAGAMPGLQGIYDPWYGDVQDFEVSWTMISAAIPGILAHATATGEARD
jgi:protein-tyrosine phosphatase